MLHKMHLNQELFDLIKSGKKIYETRLNDEKRQQIKVGDQISFDLRDDDTQKINVEVIELIKYKDFFQMIDDLPITDLGYPEDTDKVWFAGTYDQYYDQEDLEKYGVLAIKFKLL